MRDLRRRGHTKFYKCFSTLVLKLMCLMESICHNLSEVSCTSEESTARTKVTRGKSLKACVAKAEGWTLEKAKDVPMHEGYTNKRS